jgi:hypothetical protein
MNGEESHHYSVPKCSCVTEDVSCFQANLCYVDIDSQIIQLPEELPGFPQRAEFVGELVELLTKHKVSSGQVDRWVDRCSVCTLADQM